MNEMNEPRKRKRSSEEIAGMEGKTPRGKQLSDEVLLAVFAHLSHRDLASCSAVSRRWHEISADTQLWKRLYGRMFRQRNGSSGGSARVRTTKEMYKLRHNWDSGRYRTSHWTGLRGRIGELDLCADGKMITVCKHGEQVSSAALASTAVSLVTDKAAAAVGLQRGWIVFLIKHDGLHVVREDRTVVGELALCYPYLATLSQRTFYFYDLWQRLPLLSLNGAARQPCCLLLADQGPHVVATIAQTVPAYPDSYCVQVQQLLLHRSTAAIRSRTASSPPIPRPTALAFHHPYLLTCHADNTLTLCCLCESPWGVQQVRRLWGHTSAISTAGVSAGLAVSVGRRELRVWELDQGDVVGQVRMAIPWEPQQSLVSFDDADIYLSSSPGPGTGIGPGSTPGNVRLHFS